jgi:Flp pilus assembly protein TadB
MRVDKKWGGARHRRRRRRTILALILAAAAAVVVGSLAAESPTVGVAAGFGVAMATLLVQIMIWTERDDSDEAAP